MNSLKGVGSKMQRPTIFAVQCTSEPHCKSAGAMRQLPGSTAVGRGHNKFTNASAEEGNAPNSRHIHAAVDQVEVQTDRVRVTSAKKSAVRGFSQRGSNSRQSYIRAGRQQMQSPKGRQRNSLESHVLSAEASVVIGLSSACSRPASAVCTVGCSCTDIAGASEFCDAEWAMSSSSSKRVRKAGRASDDVAPGVSKSVFAPGVSKSVLQASSSLLR